MITTLRRRAAALVWVLSVVAVLGACTLSPLPPREVRGPGVATDQPLRPPLPGRILVAENAGRGGHLVFVDEAGRRLRSLTEAPAGAASFDITPAWSPDGRTVVFSSSRRAPGRAAGLWVVPADGSAPPRPLTSPEVGIDFQPSFAPDGRAVAYTASHGPSHAVYVLALDGSAPRLLALDSLRPSWSHDGATIAVTRQKGAHDAPEIWLVPASGPEGSAGRRLTGGADPSFGPGDRQVAFVAKEGGAKAGRTDADLFVIGADGSGRERVIDDALGDETSPRFSADGRFLFAESYVRDADGKSMFPCIVYVDLAEKTRRLRALQDRSPGGWTSLALAPVALDAAVLDQGRPYAEALTRALVALPPDL